MNIILYPLDSPKNLTARSQVSQECNARCSLHYNYTLSDYAG